MSATFPPASIVTQINELKREKKMRERVYPFWVQTKKIKQSEADFRNAALDGAIATLERLAEERT